MSVDAVTLLFALLALACQVSVAGAAVVWVASRFSPAAQRGWRRLVDLVAPDALTLAALVAIVATGGSLYLSEGAGFPPCRLCWVQRYFMYPLAVVLPLAAWRGARRVVAPVVAGVAAAGGSVSIYHMLVERFPSLETTSCDPDNPCSIIWVEHFGYITIPTMALSGFAMVVVLCLIARAGSRRAKETT